MFKLKIAGHDWKCISYTIRLLATLFFYFWCFGWAADCGFCIFIVTLPIFGLLIEQIAKKLRHWLKHIFQEIIRSFVNVIVIIMKLGVCINYYLIATVVGSNKMTGLIQ